MERPRPTASGSSRRMMSCLWLNHSPTTGISKICIFSMKISCYRSYTSISQSTWLITDQPLQFCSAFDVVFDLCWPLFMSRRGSHAATQKRQMYSICVTFELCAICCCKTSSCSSLFFSVSASSRSQHFSQGNISQVIFHLQTRGCHLSTIIMGIIIFNTCFDSAQLNYCLYIF